MLATLIIVAILSITTLSSAPTVALSISIASLVVLPDDAHNGSLNIHLHPMPDNNEPADGHMLPIVITAIAVVLIISIVFVLALQWLRRWRPAASRTPPQARQHFPPARVNPTPIFNFVVLALQWLKRRRPAARRAPPQARQPSRPTGAYSDGTLQTYSENMDYVKCSHPSSTNSGLDVGSLGYLPAFMVQPDKAHLRPATTVDS